MITQEFVLENAEVGDNFHFSIRFTVEAETEAAYSLARRTAWQNAQMLFGPGLAFPYPEPSEPTKHP